MGRSREFMFVSSLDECEMKWFSRFVFSFSHLSRPGLSTPAHPHRETATQTKKLEQKKRTMIHKFNINQQLR